MNQPVWRPDPSLQAAIAKAASSKELRAAIDKAARTSDLRAAIDKTLKSIPPIPVGNLGRSPIQEVIDQMAKAAPAADPQAAMREALKAITPVSVGNLDWSPVRTAMDQMAERHRGIFAEIAERNALLLEDVSRMLKDAMPANLRDVQDTSALEDIVQNEGIPLVHVPRTAIVQELLDCPDHEARRKVLSNRVADVVEDCLAVLAQPLDDPADDAIRTVAIQAAQALLDGHAGPAQALAVLASEQYISDNLGTYNEARTAVNGFITGDDMWFVSYYHFYMPLFIVPSLYTPWRPTDNVPAPDALSRHVTVHQVTNDHLNTANAVISVMQVASLIGAARWAQEFWKSHPRPATNS